MRELDTREADAVAGGSNGAVSAAGGAAAFTPDPDVWVREPRFGPVQPAPQGAAPGDAVGTGFSLGC